METSAAASTPFAVLHVPHASREIPADLRPSILLSDDELDQELTQMTDAYTDELFAVADLASSVRFPVSRLVLDPERFTDDAREPLSAVGMGVIYTHTSNQAPLRHSPSPTSRAELLARYYVPHHDRLTVAIRTALLACQSALAIDCHSFPAAALPYELDASAPREDICIGTDPFHTPRWLRDLAVHVFAAQGFGVQVDRPFKGALVPLEFYNTEPRVLAVMVEVNRRLYMDEATGAKSLRFEDTRARVVAATTSLIAGARSQCGRTLQHGG